MSDALSMFYQSLKKVQALSDEEEYSLAMAWRHDQDEKALHKLVSAHTGFAASRARKFKGYKVPIQDLIQQAALGLMKATKKFDPEQGYKFSTYARWWIDAELQDYVARRNGVIQGATTHNQRRLFFHMSRAKRHVEREARRKGVELSREDVRIAICERLDVSYDDVIRAEAYASGATSLDMPLRNDEEGSKTLMDTIEDENVATEDQVSEQHLQTYYSKSIQDALQTLNEREQYIVMHRGLTDDVKTLEELGEMYGVSRERIRQVEAKAMEKIKKFLERNTNVPKLIAA